MTLYTIPYCEDYTNYKRFLTRVVDIGTVPLGGDNPIRVQSMTTTDTMNTQETVDQCIRMIESGCEYIRITAPSIKEAENLRNIKASLRKQGFQTPLVADIHFTPNAAELAAKIVEKVRVNPGNYADKKKFELIEYSDLQYEEELERIRKKFTPLVEICKTHGTAMRIGTNHGSLSDRILSKFGDTPEGMVESAMEFLRIAESLNYYNMVLSMKASNTQVMVQAYRLLVKEMMAAGMNYPLHLGVTEAGEGEDGRIKSAVGIGALLEDGLGDTVRVSLTENPEFEAPVAKLLVDRYQNRAQHEKIPQVERVVISPFSYQKRKSTTVANVGGSEVPRVIADLSHLDNIKPVNLYPYGYQYSVPLDKWTITDMAVDYIYIGKHELNFEIPGTLGIIQRKSQWIIHQKPQHFPLYSIEEITSNKTHESVKFINFNISKDAFSKLIELNNRKDIVLIIKSDQTHWMPHVRSFFNQLILQKINIPVILTKNYQIPIEETFQLYASTDFGGLFIDGLGDGAFINNPNIPAKKLMSTVFGILQASRVRISKTEYISCPSCGRTLFDLQETTAKIRNRTAHLKGIKIGIMGCIVNGPGEMADADYGYVGSGVGKITLYKGQEVVKKSIPTVAAVDELIQLIKDYGDWVELPEE